MTEIKQYSKYKYNFHEEERYSCSGSSDPTDLRADFTHWIQEPAYIFALHTLWNQKWHSLSKLKSSKLFSFHKQDDAKVSVEEMWKQCFSALFKG